VYILLNEIKITGKGKMPIEFICKVMPCCTWVAPLIWCFIPSWLFVRKSHEILLNKGMKYWNSGLNASSSRTFITRVHIAAAVIGWKRWGKERTGKTQLSFIPRWSPVYFFFCFLFLKISSPILTKQGVSSVVFSWLYE